MSTVEPEAAWNEDRHWGERPLWQDPRAMYLWFYFGKWGPRVRGCLNVLAVLLFFGLLLLGLAYSYFSSFHIRPLEAPSADLTYIRAPEPLELKTFGQDTYYETHLSLRRVSLRLKDLRESTREGAFVPSEFEQECSDIREELKRVMGEARSRRIPKQFKKPYLNQLTALGFAYQSVNKLQESFEQETQKQREKYYKDSIRLWKRARRDNRRAGDFFLAVAKGSEE